MNCEAVMSTEQNIARIKLKRDLRRESLTRLESAARTVEDYNNVVTQWDKLDKNRQRRERRHEIGRTGEEMLHWDKKSEDDENGGLKASLDTVIPLPFGRHIWWRQMLRGDFLDIIFDYPDDIHQLTSSRNISELVEGLREDQKIVLYYRAIRQWSPQKIAKLRKQTDRNIRKVYDNMIKELRRELCERLYPRYAGGWPLTNAQKMFVAGYLAQHGPPKPRLRRKNRH